MRPARERAALAHQLLGPVLANRQPDPALLDQLPERGRLVHLVPLPGGGQQLPRNHRHLTIPALPPDHRPDQRLDIPLLAEVHPHFRAPLFQQAHERGDRYIAVFPRPIVIHQVQPCHAVLVLSVVHAAHQYPRPVRIGLQQRVGQRPVAGHVIAQPRRQLAALIPPEILPPEQNPVIGVRNLLVHRVPGPPAGGCIRVARTQRRVRLLPVRPVPVVRPQILSDLSPQRVRRLLQRGLDLRR